MSNFLPVGETPEETLLREREQEELVRQEVELSSLKSQKIRESERYRSCTVPRHFHSIREMIFTSQTSPPGPDPSLGPDLPIGPGPSLEQILPGTTKVGTGMLSCYNWVLLVPCGTQCNS